VNDINPPHARVIVQQISKISARRIAEVGVLKGECANAILDRVGNKLLQYWLIDRWLAYPGLPKITQPQWDEHYDYVKTLAAQYPCAKVVRLASVDAAERMPDESLDLVFIDADHTYEGVYKDILAWLPKVRVGGTMLFHDFAHHAWPGVRQAVTELLPSAFPDSWDSNTAIYYKQERGCEHGSGAQNSIERGSGI